MKPSCLTATNISHLFVFQLYSNLFLTLDVIVQIIVLQKSVHWFAKKILGIRNDQEMKIQFHFEWSLVKHSGGTRR